MMLTPRDGPAESTSSLAGHIKLNRSFVLLCRFTSLERTKISPFACLGVLLARIKPKLPGCKFTDHKKTPIRFLFLLSRQFHRLFPQPFRRILVLRFYRRGFRAALIEVLARRSGDFFCGCEKYHGLGAFFGGDGEFLSNPEEEG